MFDRFFNFPNKRIDCFEVRLNQIEKQQEKMMAQIDQLNTAITNVATDVTGIQTDVATVIADLTAAEKGAVPIDLTAAIASLQKIHTTLGVVDTGLQAAIAADTPTQSSTSPSGSPSGSVTASGK